MASPVFHGLAGVGIAWGMAGGLGLPLFSSWKKTLAFFSAAVVVACLPDVDYFPGILVGELNRFHQQITHSVVWGLVVAIAIFGVGRFFKPAWFGKKVLLLLLLLMGSHLLVDWLTADFSLPIGIPLWAPFSWTTWASPFAIFPAWDKNSLMDLATTSNLRPLGVEITLGLLFVAACGFAKRVFDAPRNRAMI